MSARSTWSSWPAALVLLALAAAVPRQAVAQMECNIEFDQCGGFVLVNNETMEIAPFEGPFCCEDDLECIQLDEGGFFSQCLRPIPPVPPPSDVMMPPSPPTPPPPPAPFPPGTECAGLFDQCGGIAIGTVNVPFAGPGCCQEGLSCIVLNPFFSQCRQDPAMVGIRIAPGVAGGNAIELTINPVTEDIRGAQFQLSFMQGFASVDSLEVVGVAADVGFNSFQANGGAPPPTLQIFQGPSGVSIDVSELGNGFFPVLRAFLNPSGPDTVVCLMPGSSTFLADPFNQIITSMVVEDNCVTLGVGAPVEAPSVPMTPPMDSLDTPAPSPAPTVDGLPAPPTSPSPPAGPPLPPTPPAPPMPPSPPATAALQILATSGNSILFTMSNEEDILGIIFVLSINGEVLLPPVVDIEFLLSEETNFIPIPNPEGQNIGLFSPDESVIAPSLVSREILAVAFDPPPGVPSGDVEVCLTDSSVLAGFNFSTVFFTIADPPCVTLVIPEDTEPPVINVNGFVKASKNVIDQCDLYLDPGATAEDSRDGDITAAIVTGGVPVDTTVPGIVTITYDVSDFEGNPAEQKKRFVTVVENAENCAGMDTTAPVIDVIGKQLKEFNQVEACSTYIDEGAMAFDNMDGDITDAIVTTGLPIDTSVLGTQTITYDVTDSAGNMAKSKKRFVEIIDTDGFNGTCPTASK